MTKLQVVIIVLTSLIIGAIGAGMMKNTVLHAAKILGCLNGKRTDYCYTLGMQAYAERNLDSARSFLGAACGGNHVEACTDLSGVYFEQKDYDSALKYAKLGCEQNDPSACYNVACAWCRKDHPEEAARVLKALAAKGYFWTAKHREHSFKDPDLACLRESGVLEKIVNE